MGWSEIAAESSVLVKDPHLDPALVALYVRFKGNVPPGAELTLDGRALGPAMSPFKVTELPVGPHELAIRAPGGSTAAHVRFLVKGAR